MLDDSKSKLGPYSVNIAEEFIAKTAELKAQKLNPGRKTQENINFVKMEYFLYGLAQAASLVEEI